MPNYTSRFALPSPTLTEAPNGPAAFQALADATDTAINNNGIRAGLSTARPAHRDGLMFYETDTKRVVISNGGAWSIFGSVNQPAVRLSRSTDQSIPDSTATKITYTAIDYDSGTTTAQGSTTGGTITIRENGLYLVEGYCVYPTTGNTSHRSLILNVDNAGVRTVRSDPSIATGAAFCQVTLMYRATVGQVLHLEGQQGSGSAKNINPAYFSATLLSRN